MSESQPPSYESSESTHTETSHPSESHQPGSTGTGLGERFMGAMGAIHGAGENLRGNVIGALDTLFGGKNEEEARRVAQKGQEEMHSGVQRMKGRSKDARETTAAEGQPQPRVQEPHEQASSQEQPTRPTQQVQPPPQAQPQGQPVQMREGQPQSEVPQKQVDERQAQQEPPQPVSERAGGEGPEQTGVVDAPGNVDAGRDEQKIPATSS